MKIEICYIADTARYEWRRWKEGDEHVGRIIVDVLPPRVWWWRFVDWLDGRIQRRFAKHDDEQYERADAEIRLSGRNSL